MKKGKYLFVLLAICLIAATAQTMAQDLTLHETTTSTGMMGRGGQPVNATTYLTPKAIKVASADGNDSVLLLDAGKIILVNNKQKTYSETTFQQLQQKLDEMTAEMNKNPEQAEMMKKMMGNQGAASFTVTPEGPGEEIAGYATQKYLVKGPMEMEIWAAPALKMPVQYYDAMKLQMPKNPMFDMGKLYDEMKKINGLAVKTVTTMRMMGMEIKSTRVVTSVDKGAIPASTFAAPAGYKLVDQPFK
jgi:hypothetical protein